MIQVFDEMTAPSINGTSLKGYIEGWSYDDMVHVLGKPTLMNLPAMIRLR